jgi:hypothetical protein
MPCRCRFRFPSQTYTATFSDSDTTAFRKTLISIGFCDQNVCLFLLSSPWGVDLVLPSETRRQSAHSLPACVIKPATMGPRVSYTRPTFSLDSQPLSLANRVCLAWNYSHCNLQHRRLDSSHTNGTMHYQLNYVLISMPNLD